MLGIRTWGRRMVGADETTELWRPPLPGTFCWSTIDYFEGYKGKFLRYSQIKELLPLGKYNCMAGLQFYKFALNCFETY